MPSWVIEESILYPREKIEINYKGQDPFQLYKKMDSSFLQATLEVGGTAIWERDFRWSADSDPHNFYIRIMVQKGFDRFTEAYYDIIFEGAQPSDPKKEGNVRVAIGGNIRTTFRFETGFQQTPIYRALVWLYFKIFYSRIRRNYFKIAQEDIYKLVRAVRSWIGAPEVV